MTKSIDIQHDARRRGGRILRFPSLDWATQDDFTNARTAICIHGFTANATYMTDLMRQLSDSGFTTLAFEYPSDRGIHQAARVLRELLENYDNEQTLSNNRVVLVCHSMGGLVGRALIAFEGGDRYVRKLITIGTPHNGTLKNDLILRLLLKWGEHVSGINPYAFSPGAISAKELLQNDDKPTLLSRMRDKAPEKDNVQFYSLSGGLNALDFGHGNLANTIANIYIQLQLALPNDGLVEEASSNLSGTAFNLCAPNCRHENAYAEYPYTNHTHLVNNQMVARKVITLAQ